MKFTEAMPHCLGHYADFSGRASRSEFWFFWISYLLLFLVSIVIAAIISEAFAIVVYVLLGLGFFLPYMAVSVRRLHDSGKSGLWLLLGFVPFGGLVIFVFYLLPGDIGSNKFGVVPD